MPAITRFFTLAVPAGLSTVKLDSKGCATCQITVKNVSGTTIDGRGILVSMPKSASGPVEKGWVTIVGQADRRFEPDQEEVFSLKIAVQTKKGEPAPAGNYSVRLDVINVARPDDSADQSQALGFTVAAVAPKPPSKWPLIAAVAALVLIAAGVTIWLLTRGNPVPDLKGKTATEAFTILASAKLVLDQNFDHMDSTPENSGKILSQLPAAGDRASSGSKVKVTLGSPMVTMPTLTGHNFADAQRIANQSGLGAITSTTAPNWRFPATGIVWDQTPAAGQNVRTGTAVSLKITPQDIPVVSVIGLRLQDAYAALQRGQLTVGQVQGYALQQLNVPVVSQNPGPGTMVAVGTQVNLVMQCPFPSVFGTPPVCQQVMHPATVQQFYLDQARTSQFMMTK